MIFRNFIRFFTVLLILSSSLHAQLYLRNNLHAAAFDEIKMWEDATSFVHYIEDPLGNMQTMEALSNLDNKRIDTNASPANDFQSGKIYWLTFILKNGLNKKQHLVADFGQGNTVHLYRLEANSLILMAETEKAPDPASPSPSPSFLRFDLKPQQGPVFLARLEYHPVGKSQPFKLLINSFDNILNREARTVHTNALIFGILLVLAIYHAAIGYTLKDNLYYFHTVFLLCCSFLLFANYNVDLQFIHPIEGGWARISPVYCLIFAGVAWGQFTKLYLDIPASSSFLNLIFNAACMLFVVPLMLLITGSSVSATNLAIGCGLILVITITFAILWSISQNSPHASYYLISNLILLIAGGLFVAQHYRWTPPNAMIPYLLQIGVVAQACLLSLGLANRLSLLRKEKEAALQREIDNQKANIEIHRQTTEAYARFVPMEFFQLLDKKDILEVQLGDAREHPMTVLFSDICSYSTMCEKFSSADSFRNLNEYLKHMGPIIRKCGGFIDKYIGDAIMALFPNSANDAANAAINMMRELNHFNAKRTQHKEFPFSIGIGIHTGKLILGTVGEEKRMEGTVISDVVNIASRLEGLTRRFNAEIIVSDVMLQEAKGTVSSYRFLGETQLRGKTEATKFYEIFQADEENVRALKNQTKSLFEEAVALFLQNDFSHSLASFEDVLRINADDLPAQYYLNECKLKVGNV